MKKVLSLTGVDLKTEDSFREIDSKEAERIALAFLIILSIFWGIIWVQIC
jgi:hypothetical protein